MTSPEAAPVVAIIVSSIFDIQLGKRLWRPSGSSVRLADTIAPDNPTCTAHAVRPQCRMGGVHGNESTFEKLGDDVIENPDSKGPRNALSECRCSCFPSPRRCRPFDRNATAFGLRDDQWDDDVISAMDRSIPSADLYNGPQFWTAVEPFATGEVYVNPLYSKSHADHMAPTVTATSRLVALKNKTKIRKTCFRLNRTSSRL